VKLKRAIPLKTVQWRDISVETTLYTDRVKAKWGYR